MEKGWGKWGKTLLLYCSDLFWMKDILGNAFFTVVCGFWGLRKIEVKPGSSFVLLCFWGWSKSAWNGLSLFFCKNLRMEDGWNGTFLLCSLQKKRGWKIIQVRLLDLKLPPLCDPKDCTLGSPILRAQNAGFSCPFLDFLGSVFVKGQGSGSGLKSSRYDRFTWLFGILFGDVAMEERCGKTCLLYCSQENSME